jgi:hypothetical protein
MFSLSSLGSFVAKIHLAERKIRRMRTMTGLNMAGDISKRLEPPSPRLPTSLKLRRTQSEARGKSFDRLGAMSLSNGLLHLRISEIFVTLW